MSQPDFTISDVLAWARTKPADERYDYDDVANCAMCQFLRDTGRASDPNVGSLTWDDLDNLETLDSVPFDPRLDKVVKHGSHTFGALVTRLEALCPDQVIPPSEWTRLDSYMTDELVQV